MSCGHTNPAGYLFCGRCGVELNPGRCRCGFVVAMGDVYCGRCGASLAVETAQKPTATIDSDRRFDLEFLTEKAAQEKKFLESTHKVRVTQDDIRKLLSTRRKRF